MSLFFLYLWHKSYKKDFYLKIFRSLEKFDMTWKVTQLYLNFKTVILVNILIYKKKRVLKKNGNNFFIIHKNLL